MKKLKLEEMLVNAIQNPGKKFTHPYWKQDEYIFWFQGGGVGYFKDEKDYPEDISDYAALRDGWMDYSDDKRTT